MGADLVLLVVLLVMSGAIALDRYWAAAETPVARPDRAARGLSAAAPEAVAAALPVPDLAELAGCSEGWALLGPTGTVVATNLPERAAQLAGVCAMLRLARGPDGAQGPAWRTVTLEGPAGILLGEASTSGAVLAVLARRDADRGELRRAIAHALGKVERRWPGLAVGEPGGAEPGPGSEPAAAALTPSE